MADRKDDAEDLHQALRGEVRACTICAEHLPLGPRPVLRAHFPQRILVAGQAPGRRVHESGVPCNPWFETERLQRPRARVTEILDQPQT